MNFVARISKNESGNIVGRIGGNIPNELIIKTNELNGYLYYLTIESKDDEAKLISIFIYSDYDKRIEHRIYPEILVKVFLHNHDDESEIKDYTITELSKANLIGYDEVDDENFDFITLSDNPMLIQEEKYYYSELEKDGYKFFMQVDEFYYPENIVKDRFIFSGGALYLYRKNDEIIAGFWQFS